MDGLTMLERYFSRVTEAGPWLWGAPALGAVLFALFWSLSLRVSPRLWRLAPLALVVVAGAVGFSFALDRAAMYDDAYISFRYARNLAEGHGLVFNVGEKVEGYTNFLWTVGIALVMRISPFDAPEIALVGCLLCFVLNVLLCFRLSQALRRERPEFAQFPPLAAVLLAVQGVFTDYATTGMETGLACAFVLSGTLALVQASTARGVFASGLAFILAVLTRPDHALFYAVGSAVVVLTWGRDGWAVRRQGLRAVLQRSGPFLLAWAAPFVLYLAVAAFKYSYYGSLVPNTYYAKSADQWYFSQGALYAESFYLGTHFWLVGLLFLGSLLLGKGTAASERFRWFAGPAWFLYNLYVMKVGGDFMFGRFYVSVMPLMLLGAELLVARVVARVVVRAQASPRRLPLALASMLCGTLLATAGGVRLLKDRQIEWYLSDESTYYRLEGYFPVVVNHSNFRIGNELRVLSDAGFTSLIATSGIGMLGYNSRFPVLDRMGLTDAVVARQKIERRTRPGHEKHASAAYVRERMPLLVRGEHYIEKPYRRLRTLRFETARSGREWYLYHYDAQFMNLWAELSPGIKFTRFEPYLDRYLEGAKRRRPKDFLRDYRFFYDYYFNHNDDPDRECELQELFRRYEQRAER